MTCKKCKSEGIKNHANGIEFYYCRTCKEEIEEELPNYSFNTNVIDSWRTKDSYNYKPNQAISFDEEDDGGDWSNKWAMVWE